MEEVFEASFDVLGLVKIVDIVKEVVEVNDVLRVLTVSKMFADRTVFSHNVPKTVCLDIFAFFQCILNCTQDSLFYRRRSCAKVLEFCPL